MASLRNIFQCQITLSVSNFFLNIQSKPLLEQLKLIPPVQSHFTLRIYPDTSWSRTTHHCHNELLFCSRSRQKSLGTSLCHHKKWMQEDRRSQKSSGIRQQPVLILLLLQINPGEILSGILWASHPQQLPWMLQLGQATYSLEFYHIWSSVHMPKIRKTFAVCSKEVRQQMNGTH